MEGKPCLLSFTSVILVLLFLSYIITIIFMLHIAIIVTKHGNITTFTI